MKVKEDDLRAVATKRVRMKGEFWAHLTSYLIINTALAAIWALTGAGYPWFVWPLIGWGIGLAFHAVALWLDLAKTSATGIDRETRAIERELQRLQERPTEH